MLTFLELRRKKAFLLLLAVLAVPSSHAFTEFLPLLDGDAMTAPAQPSCGTVVDIEEAPLSRRDPAWCESPEAKRLLAEEFPAAALNQAIESHHPPGHPKAGIPLCDYCRPKDPSGLTRGARAQRKDLQGYYRLDRNAVVKACNSILMGSALKTLYQGVEGSLVLIGKFVSSAARGAVLKDIEAVARAQIRDQVLRHRSSVVQALVRDCRRTKGEENEECYSYRMNRVVLAYLDSLNNPHAPAVDAASSVTILSEVAILSVSARVSSTWNQFRSFDCLPMEQRMLLACDTSGELLLKAYGAYLSGAQLARWAKMPGRTGQLVGAEAGEVLAAEALIQKASGSQGKARVLLDLQKKLTPERYAQLFEKALLDSRSPAEFTEIFANRALHAKSVEMQVAVNNKLHQHVETFFARKPAPSEIQSFLDALPEAGSTGSSLVTLTRQNVTQDLLNHSSSPTEYLSWARPHAGSADIQRMIHHSKPHFEEMLKKVADPKKVLEYRRSFLKLLEKAAP